MDMGLSAVLRRGHIRLPVTSKPVLKVAPALFRVAGSEPAATQIVAVKSHIQLRAGYGDLARHLALLGSPGMSGDHSAGFGFQRVDHLLFPHDKDVG